MNLVNSSHQINETDIAIIGMSGRFPGADNIQSFWKNLQDGVESIAFFSSEEVLASGVEPELLSQPNYVKAKAILGGIDQFDASFFGFHPREAEILDPQHRLFLECAWEALETAGYVPQTDEGAIGVFAGGGISQYYLNHIYGNPHVLKFFNEFQLYLANDNEFLATRTAYKLNLTGPAIAVQSACSTSLVAIHLACQSLLSGECDLALAGGVTLKTTQKIGYLYQEGMVFSPDGHCRAFDARAKGTVGSQGVAIVTLKRATDAIAQRACIYALIKGSAINNDGAVKVGYTAPSVDGQAKVIAEAQAIANIDAETITYIETHGTGTELGDPIEMAALTQAFRQSTDKTGFCAIGSLKTNLGHLNHAAGVAGLIKTALALHHKQIPPSLHFETANPKIDFANSPFYVNTQLSKWETNRTPRRAGVSSFGIGGTNAHVILEEAPISENFDHATDPNDQLLLLSAKTPAALERATLNLAAHLQQHPDLCLSDVAYTLSVGRKAFEYRRMLVCSTVGEAAEMLICANAQSFLIECAASTSPCVIFMFPGQGSQYVNMARDLYQQETVFREQIDRCAELLQPQLGLDLRHILYPDSDQFDSAALQQTAMSHDKLLRIYAQPALFIVEYALAKLWESWGIRPQGFIGHSIGEYVAACLAGVFSLEDALWLVAARGQMMQQLPTGAMLSVPLAAEVVQPLLSPELSIAAINEPARCVVSGSKDAIAQFQNQLAAQGTESRCLHTSHAFHSAMMDAILEPFAQRVQAVRRHPPTLPFISNVTGNWITATQAIDPNYWSQHLRAPVQFARGIEQCLRQPAQILLEIGPGRTLSTFVKRHTDIATQRVFACLRHPQETGSDVAFLFTTLGQLWLTGVEVDWSGVYRHQPCNRVALPTYPFERQRYWVTPPTKTLSNHLAPARDRQADIANWFYIPSWQRCPLMPTQCQSQTNCILLLTDEGLGNPLLQQFQQSGKSVIQVKVGSTFTQENQTSFVCNPGQPESYELLLKTLAAQGDVPGIIVHCWSLINLPSDDLQTLDRELDYSFYSLIFLAQAYGRHRITHDVELLVISSQMQDVLGTENLRAATATLLGTIRTIPQEYANWHCRSIDLVWSAEAYSQERQWLMTQLEAELASSAKDSVIAYRGKHRWVQTFEPVRLEKEAGGQGAGSKGDSSSGDSTPFKREPLNRSGRLKPIFRSAPQQQEGVISPCPLPPAPFPTPPLRPQGVYLITGGLGGIGLSIARYLAGTVQAKLVLLSRSPLFSQKKQQQWCNQTDQNEDEIGEIRLIQDLENLGAEVLVLSADVANLEQMQQAIAQILEKFGQIHGVVHAAGLPAGGAIELKTKPQAADILRAKVHGTLVLNQVLKLLPVDWWVLCSSLTSVLGGFGQVDYCAANAFLDAFAHQKNRHDQRTLAINWDAWQQVGMAAAMLQQETHLMKAGSQRDRLRQKLQTHQLGLMPTEGVEAFSRILSVPFPQILVSTQTLGDRLSASRIAISKFDQNVSPEDFPPEHTPPEPSYDRPQLSTSYRASRNATEQAIAKSWQETLGIKLIGINDNFFELGGDSLTAIQILSNLQASLQTSISLQSFLNTSTVAELAVKIEGQKTILKENEPHLSSCLVKLRAGKSTARPLFLVHSGGGSLFLYRDLVANLNSDRTVFGLKPDLNKNPAIQSNIVEIARSYIEAVKIIQPSGSYCLGGHSFGGIVALEMAQQLKAQGEEIELLAVIDSSLEPRQKLELNTQTDLLTFLLDMGVKQPKYRPILQILTPKKQLNYFLQHQNPAAKMLKNLDKTPLLNFLQIFKLNNQAMADYDWHFYQGQVVFFKPEEADAVTNPNSEQTWLKLTNNLVELHTISGNHLTMLNSDNAIALAEILNQYLT